MFKLVCLAIVAFALSACSDKPAVYTANKMFGGQDIGVTVKLKFNHFTDKNSEGDGVAEVVKSPGSQWAGTEGTFPITWKKFPQLDDSVAVSVPDAHDAFMLARNPMQLNMLGEKSYWCQDCEQGRAGGLGILPGIFVRND